MKRVHELLSTIRFHGDSSEAEKQFGEAVPDAPVQTSTSKKKKPRAGAQIRNEIEILMFPNCDKKEEDLLTYMNMSYMTTISQVTLHVSHTPHRV